MMTAKVIQLTTLCVFLLFQLTFGAAETYEYYYQGNLRLINIPNLTSRASVVPLISSRSDSSQNNQNSQNVQNIQAARSAITHGSEMFSFEMFHVSEYLKNYNKFASIEFSD